MEKLDNFLDTGIVAAARESANDSRTGFMEFVTFLKRPDVAERTHALLEHICSVSTKVHGACKIYFGGNQHNAKAFLGAYLIHHNLDRLVTTVGENEFNLLKCALSVLSVFDEIVAVVREKKSFCKIPADLAKNFNTVLVKYFRAFQLCDLAEKKPTSWLLSRSTLVSLYFAFFNHQKSDHPLRMQIQEQIKLLRARTVEDHGQACLDGFDAELREGKFGLPPMYTDKLEVLDADPKYFILRYVDRIQLVQELYLDINYKETLENLRQSPVHVHVTLCRDDGFHWGRVHLELLIVPQKFKLLHIVFHEFKQAILDIAGDERESFVNASLDLNLLHNSGWEGCVKMAQSIVDLIQRIQLPVRRKETKDGWGAFETISTPEEMVGAVKFIYKCLKIAECDKQSVKVLLVSRAVNENGREYIQKNFLDRLSNGMLTMERTKVRVYVGFIFSYFPL
jgi:hypothetical protein